MGSEIKNKTTQEQNKGVSLNISENTFADIILNFLGEKQKLSYKVDDHSFKIEHNDVEQFYYLLETKTKKEQFISVNYFSLTIFYDDSTKREITTIEKLNNFLETRNVSVKSIVLNWNIVLKFPNAQTIENQKIELLFDVNEAIIILDIEHTNQAWGIEVLNLFKDHIQTLIYQDTFMQKMRKKIVNESLFHSLIETIIIISTLYLMLGYLNYDKRDNGLSENSILMLSKVNQIYLKEKNIIDAFLSYEISKNECKEECAKIISSDEAKKIIYKYLDENKKKSYTSTKEFKLTASLLSISVTFLIMLWNIKKYYLKRSFILLTQKTIRGYEEYNESKRKIQYYTITTISVTIILSIIANFLYDTFIK